MEDQRLSNLNKSACPTKRPAGLLHPSRALLTVDELVIQPVRVPAILGKSFSPYHDGLFSTYNPWASHSRKLNLGQGIASNKLPVVYYTKGHSPCQAIHDGVFHQGHISGLFPHWRDGIPRDRALLGHLGEEFLGLAHGERCSRRQHPGPEGCSACWGSSRRRDVEHLDGGASHTPSRSQRREQPLFYLMGQYWAPLTVNNIKDYKITT